MRMLFLSFYFTPDLSAGSFRAAALIKALKHQLPLSSHIDVLTTMPNRYSSFNVLAQESEEESGLSIVRIPLPLHNSGMIEQSKAFLNYVLAVRKHVRNHHYDLVFATSSRLMTAVLGASIARAQSIPLYLDIRDIFVDTIQDVLPRWLAGSMGFIFSWLERYAVGYASKVNLVSQGFEEYFRTKYPDQNFGFYTNGIDDEFIPAVEAITHETVSIPPYSVLYAGNIGEGQGLHIIVPELAKSMYGQIIITVIGDGGRRAQLANAIVEAGLDNVIIQNPVKRSALVKIYSDADILFLHLNDYKAFRKVIPSKIFEYAASGKPILAGVAGYMVEFIERELDGAEIFEPFDVNGAVKAISMLDLQQVCRKDFIIKYKRSTIMENFSNDIISVAKVIPPGIIGVQK